MGNPSLTDALEATALPIGIPCSVGKLLDELSPGDAATVLMWFDSPDLSAAHIARALTHAGHDIRSDAITRHRRHDCRCGR